MLSGWIEAISMTISETTMRALIVVDDDPDIQFLVEALFAIDPRFYVADVADSAEAALEWSARTAEPGIVVLDHSLSGALKGLDAAPMIKAVAPHTKIILFTGRAALKARADQERSVDAFLVKASASLLLPLAQQLTGLTGLTKLTS